jgi:hypothetical protein
MWFTKQIIAQLRRESTLESLTPWRPKEEQARMVQLPPSHVRGGAWYRVRIRLASQSITAEFRVN